MGPISTDAIDYLFSSTTTSLTQLDYVANLSLSRGIDFFQKGDYRHAALAFRSSIGLSPGSDNSAQAYDYLAQAYLKQNNTAAATKTYQEAIRVYPTRDNFHLKLGDIYSKAGNKDSATVEYQAAVRLDPTSSDNRYSLGQLYLANGKLSAAKEQFAKVINYAPRSATGYYGLGQAARQAGDFPKAVSQLNKAIAADKTFNNAYLELGYAYADMGLLDKAGEQAKVLSYRKSVAASTLNTYIAQSTQPKISAAYSPDGFNSTLGAGTGLESLADSLTEPGSSQLLSMNFMFSKGMDPISVQNPLNWSITRASLLEGGGLYNNGLKPPDTEAVIQPIPVDVTYSADSKTATVQFQLRQNATGNATLDPSHLVFKFTGVDAYKHAMDKGADEYSGFAGIA
jgi:Tfp pilus assembly protein PilF